MTIYTSPQDGTDRDCPIYFSLADTNVSGQGYLYIGERNDQGSGLYRSLLWISLAGIPANAKVTAADIKLVVGIDRTSNARTMRAYRLKRAWVEAQATWNSYSTGNAWQTAGAIGANDIEATELGNVSVSATPSGTITIPCDPAQIQLWVDTPASNLGVLLKMDTEADDATYYYSHTNGTSGNRPYMVVTYLLGGQVIIWSSE
jgi:hypothetical protein